MSNKDNLVFESNKKLKSKASKDNTKTNNLQYKKEKPTKNISTERSSKKKEESVKLTRKQKVFYIFKVMFFSMLGLFLSGSIILAIIISNWLSDLPELDISLLTDVSQTSLIYDKNGDLITSYSSYENRQWVSIDEIPQDIKDAIVSVEDKRFFTHNGVDKKRFIGAILGQLSGGADYGGSTLTQQLIKNVYLTSEVTYKRKAQEIALALKLEKKMSKDEILEAYLNIIYLGGSNYGVKSAAKDYFNKELNELTTRECAMLAGLTQNPNGYNPRKNLQKGDMSPTNKRTDIVLFTMHENGKLTDREYEEALKEEVVISETSQNAGMYPYAHYVEYVLEEVAIDLLKQEGKEITNTNLNYKKYSIRNGGYKIYTTLDPNIQTILQESAANYNNYPNTEDAKGTEVSAVIMDQKTGAIVAMIGSKNEPTAQETFNRAVDSTQPVGSTMKPIAIFAPAIELGAAPSSVAPDYKVAIEGYDNNDGFPGGVCNNYPMTMREAVETSHNIPAAYFLINNVGIEKSADFLMQMGINSSHISRTGSGLALGTSDMTTLEMTGAYATIANGGVFIEPHSYTVVKDRKDNDILNSSLNKIKRRVFSEETSYLTTDMLVSEVTNGSGVNAKLDNITTAGKTGTHENKCITFAGFTGYYTSVIRISSDSYSSMYDASGGNQTAILWKDYMSKIHKDLKNKSILSKTYEELNLVSKDICKISGKLATDNCKHINCSTTEIFKEGTEPKEECDVHIAICTTTGLLAHEGCWNKGTILIASYISPNNYLYNIDHNLLITSLDELRLDEITEKCYYNHFYRPPVEPTPPPDESQEPPQDSQEQDTGEVSQPEIQEPPSNEEPPIEGEIENLPIDDNPSELPEDITE